MENYNLVIRVSKFKQMDVVKQNTTGQHMVKNMSLVVRWVIDRLLKVKTVIKVNDISGKTGH